MTEPGQAGRRVSERIEDLIKIVDAGATHVQRVYLAFLLVCTYALITVASTTDLQLLRNTTVPLPPFDVVVSTSSFMVLAPVIVLILHFHVLLQHYLLAGKLHELAGEVKNEGGELLKEVRVGVAPFPFCHLILGHQGGKWVELVMKVVVWSTLVLLPIILLTAIHVRFLPYHSKLTAVPQLSVAVDLLMVWILWAMMMEPVGRSRSWWYKAGLSWGEIVAGDIPSTDRPPGFGSLLLTTGVSLAFCFLVAIPPGGLTERAIRTVFSAPGWSVRPGANPACRKGCPSLTWFFFEKRNSIFHRSLRLSEGVLVSAEVPREDALGLRSSDSEVYDAAFKGVIPLRLTGRDLRYADFRDAAMPKIDLRGADLTGADLSYADLTEARLDPMKIETGGPCLPASQEKNLACVTVLTGALFQDAKLPRANLSNADLEGAHLSSADLRSADLSSARLDGADLTDAKLTGADLKSAWFKKTDLKSTELYWADLSGAHLEEAKLTSTHLEASNLERAKFEDSVRENAAFDFAYLCFTTGLRDAELNVPLLDLCAEGPTQMTAEDYADQSAAFLYDLACRDEETAKAIVKKAADTCHNEESPLDILFATVAGKVAARLTSEGACEPLDQDDRMWQRLKSCP